MDRSIREGERAAALEIEDNAGRAALRRRRELAGLPVERAYHFPQRPMPPEARGQRFVDHLSAGFWMTHGPSQIAVVSRIYRRGFSRSDKFGNATEARAGGLRILRAFLRAWRAGEPTAGDLGIVRDYEFHGPKGGGDITVRVPGTGLRSHMIDHGAPDSYYTSDPERTIFDLWRQRYERR